VIHAGLYYGHDSLKTKLCLQGKEMLYDLCSRHNIPHHNSKKWIIAQDDEQMTSLKQLHNFASSIGVPTRFLSRTEITNLEPDVRAQAGVLESESTGIIDSHALMSYLEADFLDRGGTSALHTAVTGIDPPNPAHGTNEYTIHTSSNPLNHSSPTTSITASTVINSAGLSACTIANLLLPPARHHTPYYAKGTYYSYSCPHPKPRHLLYPAPIPGHPGLGTHLTLDLAGRVRFGPDVEWVDDATDLRPNPARLEEAISVIQTYLPGVRREAIGLDYCGIRPKVGGRGSATAGDGFQDFIIRREGGEGLDGFVNLLGIESPGLTSCLAIAEMVEALLYR
jgi:2-hydroxyglutarate dehydrogenase